MSCIRCAGHGGFAPTTSGWEACDCFTTTTNKTVKQMWETNVVNYPLGSTTDEAYKHGWEHGYRFACSTPPATAEKEGR